MKLAIMQPYLFPYLGYFQLMHAADRFVVYDDVTFIKQGWIARNRLLINGEAAFFSVPVEHQSSHTLIRDTRIAQAPGERRWAEKLLKTFDNAYRRAPEFPRVFPLIQDVLAAPVARVGELALASLRAVAGFLDIRTSWVETSAVYDNAHLRGQERVLAICRAEGATEYLNPPGGVDLYDARRFEAEGIRLRFLRPRPFEYRQFGAAFVPHLSVLDVLMFNPREAVRRQLDAHDLT